MRKLRRVKGWLCLKPHTEQNRKPNDGRHCADWKFVNGQQQQFQNAYDSSQGDTFQKLFNKKTRMATVAAGPGGAGGQGHMRLRA